MVLLLVLLPRKCSRRAEKRSRADDQGDDLLC
jgi:hypothetical protein